MRSGNISLVDLSTCSETGHSASDIRLIIHNASGHHPAETLQGTSCHSELMERHFSKNLVLLCGNGTLDKKWTNDHPTPYSSSHNYLLRTLYLGRICLIVISVTPQSPVQCLDLTVHIKVRLVGEQNWRCENWILVDPAKVKTLWFLNFDSFWISLSENTETSVALIKVTRKIEIWATKKNKTNHI